MIIAQYQNDRLIQTDISGRDPICVNGSYLIDIPEMLSINITESSVASNLANVVIPTALKQAYPAFKYLIWNPLLTGVQQDIVDSTAVFPHPTIGNIPCRFQKGVLPNSCAVLNANGAMSRPGVLITSSIELEIPSQTFALYYKVGIVEWVHDEMPTLADPTVNDGGKKYMNVSNQSPVGLSVYISSDNGSSYQQAERLTPLSFGTTTSSVRLAFVNNGDTKLYLLSYGIMY